MNKTNDIQFSENQFNKLFPFFILIDKNLEVISIGKSLKKLYPNIVAKSVNDSFALNRPFCEEINTDTLLDLISQLVILESRTNSKIRFRGQIEFLSNQQFLFIGSPWFNSIEEIQEQKLTIRDFAFHDPLIDLLHILKNQEIVSDDLKQVLAVQKRQKMELIEANNKVKDMALFPMQNPDPLFRIGFDGEVLMKNPAASQLTSFNYNNHLYNDDSLWKDFVKNLDNNNERCTVEVTSNDKIFSLVCKFLPDNKYVNIYGRDVTQEKHDKERLVLLSKISEDNINAVIIADKNGCITWVNKSFTAITEYSLDEVIGKKPGHFLQGPDTDPKIVAYISEQLKAGKPFTTEVINYSKTQKKYWIKIQFQPIFNNQNELTGFFALQEDITILKDADKKLNEQRKFYEDILNNIPADIAVFDETHKYLFVNPKSIKDDVLRNWIIGKRDEDYCILKNKSFSIAEGRRNLFNNVIRSKKSSEWEENMIDRDGNEQYLLRRMYPVIDEKGDVTLVIGYGIDITERKKIEYALKANEEKYRGIISNINLGLMEVDTEQNIEFANETLIKMLGKNYQDVIGKKVDSFLTEEGKKTLKQRIGNRKKGISEAYEILVKIGNQKKWWLASSAPRIKDEKIVGAMVVFLDINHRKELEKQLHDSREQALHLAKTKEAFLANMSHEIRTPMNALIGMGNQLAKTQLDDKQHFYLNTINNAAENLLVIINDILDLSKIEAGKLSLEKIDFELNDVLLRAMNVMMHKAEEKGLYFVNSYLDSRLLNVLIGDPYRLNQILLNLISNSIKFTEKGKIDIRCELLSENKTTQKIKIIVEDTGIGMSESFSKILFQKFTQEEESATRKYGGTGLGMSICRDLVELMNGKIYAESIKDIGTKISLEITFKKGKHKQKIKKDPVKNVLIDIKNVKVLIADDNQMNRLVAATVLNNYECIIDEATNGEEVLKKITETNFDIILMDIQMPLLDGIATTKKIREQQNCIPIIALTAYAIKGDKENFVKAGMNDYLSKPFKEQELITVINKWTKKSQKKSTNKISSSKEEIKKISPTRELYNLQTLNDISRGNKEFVEQMIGIFCDQTPIAVKEIIENYLQKNLEKVAALAHKIKPSIDNLNIISLKQVVRDIEKLAKENIDNDTLKNHIANLDAVIKDVVLDMKKNVLKTSSS